MPQWRYGRVITSLLRQGGSSYEVKDRCPIQRRAPCGMPRTSATLLPGYLALEVQRSMRDTHSRATARLVETREGPALSLRTLQRPRAAPRAPRERRAAIDAGARVPPSPRLPSTRARAR